MIPTNMHLEKLPFIWMWVDIHESAGDLSPNEVDVQIQEDHIENGEDENYEGVSGKSSKY